MARGPACASSRGLISRAPVGAVHCPRPERSSLSLPFRRLPGLPFRRLCVVATAAALGVLAVPAVAVAHSSAPVIAVDYQAKLARSAIAPGVTARVIDGNRKLELTVRPPHTVVVEGYGGEPFLRFDRAVVSVNERSPTAVTNKLTESGATPALDKGARPRWRSVSRSQQFAWHDHRLALVPGSMVRTGRIGTWSIPVRVDGAPLRVEGGLWHDRGAPVWPWLIVLAAAVGAATAVALRASPHMRRTTVYACAGVAGSSFLFASSGFSLAHSTPGTWVSMSLPFVIATIAIGVFVLRSELRYAVATGVGLVVVAESLGQLSVFLHGYVISVFAAPVARGAVAVALLGGLIASIVALTGLFSDRSGRPSRAPVKSPPKLAIPKGRRR
jgi:hypothetical protein